ncbi:MAG: carboxy terminal-processing peptidase [Lewinellaceae bacterium]|nr:carboxy terminal-processing peptidase [Phaeodactylibacter sp.]MCB0615073.1 carboxy terminal-processing peptidase [Phaeodactylibacter sp.]MCB9348438.1 carboxy terminal-processing peptidase [Lewinellaceae bacterium]
MKYRGPIFFSIIAIALLAAAIYPQVEDGEKEAVLMQTIITGFNQLHFRPKAIDDTFSEDVFNFYIDQMDGSRRFLTEEDIVRLEPYKYKLDDEINASSFEFFNLSQEIRKAGFEKTQDFYREALAQPFDYNAGETIELDGKKRPFAKNDAELRDFWRKYAKYETMQRLATKLEEQEGKGEEEEPRSFEELEIEARQDVLEFFDDWYNRIEKMKREDFLSQYLNTITHIFDPHSEYYQPIDKENFNIQFSGRLEGIGASLRTEGDYTKVVRIVVGGPAWKQKELEEDDTILKVKQEDEKDPVDITGMQINDVVQLIRGKKGTNVTLTIKKIDGTVEDITIERDIVVLEEQFAKSLILEGAVPGERIGYINLPSFYADFQNSDGQSSAKDIETELEKLKAEKVDGIVLDLRYNGGGSLRDVQKMTGYFIEKGPVVQVKSRGSEPEVLRDVDPRVQYDGPLIVMVNTYSASASEILAAALQDYDRAIIVGSKSTFGKGTVQRFLDLDRTIRGYNEIKPLGEIKLTIQKFFRINGGSNQLKGVESDIVLPDNFHYIETGERDREYAMEWTEIEPAQYSQNVMKIQHMDQIRQRSEARVAQDTTFQKVLKNALRLKEQRDYTEYPLQLASYQSLVKKQEEEAKQFDGLFDQEVNHNVANLDVDLSHIELDESRKARNDDWVQSVTKDIYIRETMNIMHDLIELK